MKVLRRRRRRERFCKEQQKEKQIKSLLNKKEQWKRQKKRRLKETLIRNHLKRGELLKSPNEEKHRGQRKWEQSLVEDKLSLMQ